MGLFDIILVAIGLAMDAFAVSIGKGLCLGKVSPEHGAICGAWFGGFQFLMPLGGFFLGRFLIGYIEKIDHWIAFALLVFIGGKMIYEAIFKKEDGNADFSVRTMLLLAVATSIDALAVGISFALLQTNIWFSSAIIGAVTFAISFLGTIFGGYFGGKAQKAAQILGGAVLVGIGIKILIEHLTAGK